MSSQAASTGSMGSRGLSDAAVMEAFANLMVSTTDERVRKVLLRIKSCESMESNARTVSSAKVPDLQATLMFLRGSDEDITTSEVLDLLQPGLVHCVLLEVSKLLPYQCCSCSNAVINERLVKAPVLCRGCGIGACAECFPTTETGWSFMCPPCGTILDKSRMIPDNLIKSRGRKKSSANHLISTREIAAPESLNEEVTIEDVDETIESGVSQDESNLLPPGQGSPPLQSTQAGSSTGTLREFPGLSFEMSTIQGSQGNASSQIAAETGDGSNEAVEDLSVGFIEPPKRVKAVLQKQKLARRTQEALTSTQEDGVLTTCRFFLKGNCKFGFFGKGKAGQGKCPYKHPKTCRKLMDNGNGLGGCSKGKACEFVHPKMCHQSMMSRSCPNIKDGARCMSGYHVRGTKFAYSKPLGENNTTGGIPNPEVKSHKGSKGGDRRDKTSPPVSSTPSFSSVSSAKPLSNGTSLGDQQAAMSSVFSEIIRAEVVKLLQTGTLWPQKTNQSCGPAVPPVTLRGPDTTTPMGNLGALLSLLGAQQQQQQ
jgi:hypothetical protein